MNFKDKRALVIGGGRSGIAARDFLIARGATVRVYDDTVDTVEAFDGREYDIAVISPGVPITHPLAVKYKDILTSEFALGLAAKHKRIIAITGTNGKTTVVNMIANALGDRGVLCGNCGIPVTSVGDQLRKKTAVAEVSSFMLESPGYFRPNIAVILNITQDHLDRHGTMEQYIAEKNKIATHQKRRDKLVLNFDCPNTRKLVEGKSQQIYWFSKTARVRGAYVEDGHVMWNARGRAVQLFHLREFAWIKNPHDVANLLACVVVCMLLGVGKKNILNIGNINEHRIQHIVTKNDIAFYNDSKATNIGATLSALSSFSCPVNLLVGGMAKGQDFRTLFEQMPKQVSRVFVFGHARADILAAATAVDYDHVESCADMATALGNAITHGTSPKAVVLSPACASMDEFRDYAHRGEEFIKLVGLYAEI
ncbi:MAG: UDP-N-acetylmuramoyl-L-alanine--D-glutamate ligase [Firmicutes bacterium]|nr:UDP-N-acetylmuramoyl-L-alanine--D-glutamate ligase [Bacillota bacterium]